MITFNNPGLIDIFAIKTFGISVKENDNAIGYFGTGLKYAIAILLREGQEISIFRGKEEFKFSTREVIVRKETFQVVTMNNEELGFTIDVGKNWELWQAYRELYANVLDEGGSVLTGSVTFNENNTNIIVRGDKFREIHFNKDSFILSNDLVFRECLPGLLNAFHGTTNSCFYKGFKVHELSEEMKFLYTYNMLANVKLTEDRTIKSTWDIKYYVALLFLQTKDEEMLKNVLLANESFYENTLDFAMMSTKPSETFMKVMRELYKDKGLEINKTAIRVFLENNKEDIEPVPCEINGIEKEQLEIAKAFIKSLDYEIDKFPIIITKSLGPEIFGLASLKDNKIYLSKNAFERGTTFLTETLIEEFIHLEYRHMDCSRAMQDYLFRKIVSLGVHYIWKKAL